MKDLETIRLIAFAEEWHNLGGCEIPNFLRFAPPESIVMETPVDYDVSDLPIRLI